MIAIKNCECPIDLKICVNQQTYLESPISGTVEEICNEFMSHEVFDIADVIIKTNSNEFYNIGDWRRETYDNNHSYTIWGESDCIIPSDYFYILSELKIDHPHIVTLASRKMWDASWDIVEHEYINKYERLPDNPYNAPYPLNSSDIISLNQLNDFNQQFDVKVVQLDNLKIDGSLLALSKNLPTPFIAPDMKFVKEDTCAEQFFKLKNIPQYLIKTRAKGHNYGHPLKRTNTENTRDDLIYKKYAEESFFAMYNFINSQIK